MYTAYVKFLVEYLKYCVGFVGPAVFCEPFCDSQVLARGVNGSALFSIAGAPTLRTK